MVQPASLEGKEDPLSLSSSPLRSTPTTMSPICCGRPAIKRPTPDPIPVSAPISAPVTPPNNDFFQKFMQTFMERAQAPAALTALSLAAEARDNTDRPLKPQNPNLYYSNLLMECYYFCQQCKDHFEVAGSLGHKRISFGAEFLKDRIFN